MKTSFLFLYQVFVLVNTLAQNHTVRGVVVDEITNQPLSFANVRIYNSNVGTSANAEGEFELKLASGNYTFIISYIGHRSDSINIELNQNQNLFTKLTPITLQLQEVTVVPGVNPALEIIRKAIETKNQRLQRIKDYVFNTYTKGLIKTTKDISSSDNRIGLSIGTGDTAALKITGILENESKGFFSKPDNYKEEIIARKQTANFPASINTLTGGRIIQDFYRDDLQFFGREMISPISEPGLNFYFYYLEDSLAYDDNKVFQIYFEPDDKSDPGFYGRLFITGKNFNLIKIDVNINDAANPGGIFTKVNVFQQFVSFTDNIYMPIDYRMFVEGNFLGLAKFGFELNSIMYDYKINSGIDPNLFDMALVTVLPDADIKDKTYWSSIQTIPSTIEEEKAYSRIDSLENIPRTFWDRFSLLATVQDVNENFAVTGPLGLYHFNRVEGNGLNFGFFINHLFNKRFDSDIEFNYGFADSKFKHDIKLHYLFGEYRTHHFSVNVFDKLDVLFGESDEYNTLVPTLTSLFGKYDFKDYFYSKGVSAKITSEVFPILQLGLEIFHRTDRTAFTNSDFSFFNRNKKYDENQVIFNSTTNAITPSFKIDFRKYIEDGYYRRRTSQNKSYAVLSGEAFISNARMFNSDYDFKIYELNLRSVINSFGSTGMNVKIQTIWADNAVPFQMMSALPGNIQSLGQDFTFRTLDFAEVFGDRVTTINVKYNFGDELFNRLNIPVLEDLQLLFSLHFNAAWTKISNQTKELNQNVLPTRIFEFKKPFYEIGFGIGQMLLPLQFEFTWKLNHRGKDDFVFGINSVAF